MLDLTYVLVPNTVSSLRVLESKACLGTLEVPGVECTLFMLRGQDHQDDDWFDRRNVVFQAKSHMFMGNVSPNLDKIAVAAALDAYRSNTRPPAYTAAP